MQMFRHTHLQIAVLPAALSPRWEVMLHRRDGRAPELTQFKKACCPPGRPCHTFAYKGHFTNQIMMDIISISASEISSWSGCSCNKLIADKGASTDSGTESPRGGSCVTNTSHMSTPCTHFTDPHPGQAVIFGLRTCALSARQALRLTKGPAGPEPTNGGQVNCSALLYLEGASSKVLH